MRYINVKHKYACTPFTSDEVSWLEVLSEATLNPCIDARYAAHAYMHGDLDPTYIGL